MTEIRDNKNGFILMEIIISILNVAKMLIMI